MNEVFIAEVWSFDKHDDNNPPQPTRWELKPFATYQGAMDFLKQSFVEHAAEFNVSLNDAFEWGLSVDKSESTGTPLLRYSAQHSNTPYHVMYLFNTRVNDHPRRYEYRLFLLRIDDVKGSDNHE